MYKYLLSLILVCGSLLSQYELQNLPYNPIRIYMNDVKIYSEDYVVSVGDYGMVRIIRDTLTDYGFVKVEEEVKLNSLAFISSEDIICIGNYGKIFISNDSAMSWQSRKNSFPENLNSVIVLNDEVFLVVGNNGIILKTTDGGDNWYKTESGVTYNLNSISATYDNTTIFVVGDNGTLLKSENQGEDWEKIDIPAYVNLNQVIADIEGILYILGDKLAFIKSADNGKTFYYCDILLDYTSIFYKPVSGMHFFNKDEGFVIVSDMHKLVFYEYYTFDGGKTWEHVKIGISSDNARFSIKCFDFLNKDFGYFIENFKSYKAKIVANRLQYERLNTNYSNNFRSISANRNEYIGGIYSLGSPVELIISTDAGNTWINRKNIDSIGKERGQTNAEFIKILDNNDILLAMNNEKDSTFINESGQTGWVIKYFGYVLKSTDLGETWFEFVVPDNEMALEFKMLNNDYGLLLLTRNKYMVTKDGGFTWEYVNPEFEDGYRLIDIHCIDVGHHLLTVKKGDEFYLYQTFDEGLNWEHFMDLPDRNHIFEYKNNKMYSVTYDYFDDKIYKGYLYEYNANSKQWDELFQTEKGYRSFIGELLVADDNTMFAFHGEGEIFFTLDKWESYHTIAIPDLRTNEFPRYIVQMSDNEYIIVTNRDMLFKLSVDEETSITLEAMSSPEITLYPNPATDFIEISLGSHSVNKGLQPLVHGGEIEVYDVLGNVVWKSTINTLTPALSLREREHKIDISHLPKGVYFVRLGAYVEKFVKQ